MVATLGLCVSAAALLVATVTAWLTLFRKGKLQMTRPTQLYFFPNGQEASQENNGRQQIMVRSLLYSTAKRGHVAENMFVTIRRGETRQNFNIWVYGMGSSLRRGSGLVVEQQGVVQDHYFLPPDDGSRFTFLPGNYIVEIYATLVRAKKPLLLSATQLTFTAQLVEQANNVNGEIFFDWGPDSNEYHPHIRSSRTKDDPFAALLPFLSETAIDAKKRAPIDS